MFLLHVGHLLSELLLGLLNGIVVGLHLSGEILLQPFVLLYFISPETEGIGKTDCYGCLSIGPVVEPCFCPPVDSSLVCINADKSRDIETLDVYLQIGKRVYDSVLEAGLFFKFFF